MRIPYALAAAFVFAVAVSSCGDNGNPSQADAGPPDAGIDEKCETFATRHDELLNSPTSTDVVRKIPRHPPVDGELPQ